MNRPRPDATVVIPVLNEAEVVVELCRRLTTTLESLGLDFELLFADDGSSDGTLEKLLELRAADARVTVLSLSRNFGHHAALTAGIDFARGKAVIMMDADLQDQPEELPKLWARYQEGYDVVVGQLDTRKEPWLKSLLARAFWAIFGVCTGIQLRNVTVLRVVSRRVILALRKLPERARFLGGLFVWVGFKQASVPVERAPRAAGSTKYHLGKQLALSLHALTSFSRAPLRLAALFAGVMGMCALGMSAWVAYRKLVLQDTALGWASLTITMFTGFALTFLLLGIIGEYIAVVLSEVQSRPVYLVADRHGVDDDPADVEESQASRPAGPSREDAA